MGTLTEAMARLRDEIVSSRHARVALLGDLVRQTGERCTQVSALCAGFTRDRAGAHRAWFGRTPCAPVVPQPSPQSTVAPLPRSPKAHFKKSKKH